MNRREFLRTSALTGGSTLLLKASAAGGTSPVTAHPPLLEVPARALAGSAPLPDLSPAQWIWFPCGRCLANTFVMFRREIDLATKPVRATGWIAADSRYRLEVNGQRIQWGPPPSDPRWAEADPIDLTSTLQPGKNVIGATVLF